MIKKLIIYIKIKWYILLDRFYGDPPTLDSGSLESRVQHRENSKLARGVKKLVDRLRGMHPAARTSLENLLGIDPYDKSPQERLEELRVVEKIINNPPVKTEDDLVKTVVKNAPIYAKEQELRKLRKLMTAKIKESAADPTNKGLAEEVRAMSRDMKLLNHEIIQMKADK